MYEGLINTILFLPKQITATDHYDWGYWSWCDIQLGGVKLTKTFELLGKYPLKTDESDIITINNVMYKGTPLSLIHIQMCIRDRLYNQ